VHKLISFLLRKQVNEVVDSNSRTSLLGVEYWHTKGIRTGPINCLNQVGYCIIPPSLTLKDLLLHEMYSCALCDPQNTKLFCLNNINPLVCIMETVFTER
jgi:hypothetical protein